MSTSSTTTTTTTIKTIMTSNPTYLPSTATVQEAAQKMKELDCGFIPVGDGDRLVGVVTDRDIATRCTAAGLAFTSPLSQIMTRQVMYCCETDTIATVASNMSQIAVRRLVVLNNRTDKRLVGVVSVADIAQNCKDSQTTASLIQAISAPACTTTKAA